MEAPILFQAFVLIVIGVAVQVTHHDSMVKRTVAWMTGVGAICFTLFAAMVYFS